MKPPESWRPAPGWEGIYEASDRGRVRRASNHRPIRGSRNAKGYQQLNLRDHGRREVPLLHRLVALAFLGPAPSPEHQINHKNGVKADNRPENLEWVSARDNQLHAYQLGLKSSVGALNGRAKLTADDVRAIRESDDPGVALAERYGVTPTLISLVRKRKCWASVE